MLFKPSGASEHNLNSVGSTNHTPHTSFLPQVTEEEARAINLGILSLRIKINKGVQSSYDQGSLALVERKISLYGLPTWRHGCNNKWVSQSVSFSNKNDIDKYINTRITLADSVRYASLKRTAACLEMTLAQSAADSFAIACSKCGAKRNAANARLMKSSSWRSLRCRSCRRNTSSRSWLCPCGCKWYQYSVHLRLVRAQEYALAPRNAVRKVQQMKEPPVLTKYRRTFKCNSLRASDIDSQPRLRLGPVLAGRFPLLAA